MSALDVLLGESGVHDAIEPSHVVAQVLKDASHDAVAAAVDLQADLGSVFWVGVGQDVDGCGAIFEDDGAGGDLVKIGLCEWLVQGDVVYFFDLVAGVGEFLREVAVVGQEQDAGGIAVKAADGIDPFGGSGADQIKDRLSPLRIFGRGDIVFWFVQENIYKVVGDRDLFGADFYQVGRVDFGTRLGDEPTVDSNLPLADELSGVAAGADAAIADVLIQWELAGGAGSPPVRCCAVGSRVMRCAAVGSRVMRRVFGCSVGGSGRGRVGVVGPERAFGRIGFAVGPGRGLPGGVLAAGLLTARRLVGGLLAAAQATFFKMALDGGLTLFFSGFFFLTEGLFDRAVALFIIEFVEIVGFAFEPRFAVTRFWAAGLIGFGAVAIGFGAVGGFAAGGPGRFFRFHADNLLFYNSNE